MTKYTTELRPFESLRPGDLVGVSFGFIRLRTVTAEPDGRVTLHSDTQPPVTCHRSNWPEVATGFTKEYQASHPHEKFDQAAVE